MALRSSHREKAGVRIVTAKPSDAQAIRRLEIRVWGDEVVNRYDIPMFVRFGWAFVAKAGRRIVGAIYSYPTKRGEVYISDWVVERPYRRQGVGLQLYRRLLAAASGRPIVTMVDPKNKSSLLGHKKIGFHIAARIESPYGLREGIRLLMRRV